MAGKPAEIEVTGMREIRRSFRKSSDTNEWKTYVKSAYTGVAQLVESGARSRAAVTSRMGHVAIASIVGRATLTSASIVAFKSVPWGPGFEFGSHGRFPQFPPVVKGGRNIYPTIAAERDAITALFYDATSDALDREFS